MVIFQFSGMKEERSKEKKRSKVDLIFNQIFRKILNSVFGSIRKIQDYFKTVKEADKYAKIKINLEKIKLDPNEFNYVVSSLSKERN